jgi:hypothetical protein
MKVHCGIWAKKVEEESYTLKMPKITKCLKCLKLRYYIDLIKLMNPFLANTGDILPEVRKVEQCRF